MRVLAATGSGLIGLDLDASGSTRDLDGRRVTAIAPAGRTRLWSVVDGREIWRSDGDGWRFVVSLEEIAGTHRLDATCLADTRANPEDGILVGTSGARLARVTATDGVELVAGFDRAPGRQDWFTPWGGPPDTRTISEDSNTVYVNVHVGGVLRSRDEGETWEPTINIRADVHQVATGAGRVYAAGAHGLATSEDRGESWQTSSSGLHAGYCRAVAVCGLSVLLSASDGPSGGRAAIYRSDLDGRSFELCQAGLPDWFSGNVDSLCLDALPNGDLAAFGTEAGDVYVSGDQGGSWERVASGLDGIRRVLVLP